MSNELFPAGTVIDGRYRILRPLGSGGFARVYEAEHVQLERRAALKILNYVAEPGDTFYRRFQREAKIAANLDHPNVVTIFDFGIVEGRSLPYIAMESLEGRDLYEELKLNGPMTPARALPLFAAALEAIGEGHERGIVHKDLKPSNLFLVKPGTPQERLVVVDYGIARLNDDPEGQLTKTGAMSGTPAYLAPEYFHDQSVTPALDVYQMGLILAETLTGRRVVDAATPVAIAVAHTSGQHDISPALRQSPLGPFLKKALSVEPTERFRNASEMKRALDAIPFPGPEVSFAVVSGSEEKVATPEAFAETAMTPSDEFGLGTPQQSGGPTSNDWRAGSGTESGRPGPQHSARGEGQPRTPSQPLKARPNRARQPSQQGGSSKVTLYILATVIALAFFIVVISGAVVVVMLDETEDSVAVEDVFEHGAAAPPSPGYQPPMPGEPVSLAQGTSLLNQKLYGYAYAHAMLFTMVYLMKFYEASVANFGLESGDSIVAPPDLGTVVNMGMSQIRRSIQSKPKRPKLDKAGRDFLLAFKDLQPVADDAHSYYSVRRGFEEDGMAEGRALHEEIEESWPALEKAERTYVRLLYLNWIEHQKDLVQRFERQADMVRQKGAELILRGAELMLVARDEPGSKAFASKLKAYDAALDEYRDYIRAHAHQLDGRFGVLNTHEMMEQPAKTLSQNAHGWKKSRPQAIESARKLGREPNPSPEIQFMTQAFHQMVSNQNTMLAN